MALDRAEWALLEQLLSTAQASDRNSFLTELRARLARRQARTALIGLIEELVSADPGLAEVAPSVGSLLRGRLAAEGVEAAFTGSPLAADDVEDAYTPDDLLRIGRVRGQAEAAILREPMLDAGDVARILGSRSRNPREFARALRARGEALALRWGSRYRFPEFQFDMERGEVRPVVAEANRLLGAADDPWGVASFWFTEDERLGARPADLAGAGTRTEDLRAAVQRELAPAS